MCTVSVMNDWARTNIPPTQWTRPVFNEYQEIIRRLAELDAKLGQPDCEDPAKAAWMRDVEQRLSQIEAKQNTSENLAANLCEQYRVNEALTEENAILRGERLDEQII